MLDIQFIRDNREVVAKAAEDKGMSFDIEKLLALDEERRSLLQEIEELNSLKNDINTLIQESKSDGERSEVIAKGKEIKQKIDEREPLYLAVKSQWDALMVEVPNIISPDTPIGKSDDENVEVANTGELPQFSFVPRTHIELGEMLDIMDLEQGAKVSGYRGYYLKNEGALLALAIVSYATAKLVQSGYTPMIPPTLVKGFPLFGSGYFKGQEYNPEIDEVYQVANHDLGEAEKKEPKFLVGTAEPSLLAYYAGKTLEETELPVRLVGASQCYRSEIGSYGKDTKGMYRVHEFQKVEQVVITRADFDEANALQEEMVGLSEAMHQELGLPYRKLQICSGDMSAGKYRAFDLEAWMPGLNRYGETGSASNFLDWQSRRLQIKYKDTATGERKYVYMLNNTALPVPRILIAILENYQQEDGSVVIPEVLRPYIGRDVIPVRK
ncbi:MAG: serine--tRNA ligase [Candidatus Moranbacteria bacterium]|nr:serine--tRNA ligase [Candidatus Moranbacteria bacterium]